MEQLEYNLQTGEHPSSQSLGRAEQTQELNWYCVTCTSSIGNITKPWEPRYTIGYNNAFQY